VTIHVPGEDLGRAGAVEPVEEPATASETEVAEEPTTAEAEEAPKPKKKTRRGSRGGRNRKKKPTVPAQNGSETAADAGDHVDAEESPSTNGDFEYVPMSEWVDELETER
jgi:hypothetical protein